MDACCNRFTAAEGGTRLAITAAEKNTLVTEYSAFITTRLIYEEAHKIRGSLFDGYQRSIFVTRPSRVKCTAYELTILTDLKVTEAVEFCEVYDWCAELDNKEVVVCTSQVLKEILDRELLKISNLNVLVLDSCHLVFKDENLRFIMQQYKSCPEANRPRILALTYPLFTSPSNTPKDLETQINDKSKDLSEENMEMDMGSGDGQTRIGKNIDQETKPSDKLAKELDSTKETSNAIKEQTAKSKTEQNSVINDPDLKTTAESENDSNPTDDDSSATKLDSSPETDTQDITSTLDNLNLNSTDEFGAYENLDDFQMYEKLEWKIEEMEKELCCEMDLAEDIDGGKRIASSVSKPKEVIIEFTNQEDRQDLSDDYRSLEKFMRDTVRDAEEFIYEHRYDPTEIYGEELYEEFKNIPDPAIEPKSIFKQFIYVLDQLGPYGADKAAFSMLSKIEKLKIKVPYERHFLLLCLCTTVFLKIRCYADIIFSKYPDDWEKIKLFCTPKVHRFAEILEQFQPPNSDKNDDNNAKDEANTKEKVNDKDGNEIEVADDKEIETPDDKTVEVVEEINISKDVDFESTKMLHAIENCDFKSLSNKIEDKVNIIAGNLKEIEDYTFDDDLFERRIIEITNETKLPKDFFTKTPIVEDLDSQSDSIATTEDVSCANEIQTLETDNRESKIDPYAFQDVKFDVKFPDAQRFGFKRTGHRLRGRGRTTRGNLSRNQQNSLNADGLCGVIFMKEPLMAKILFMLIVDMSRWNQRMSCICAQYCCSGLSESGTEAKRREEVLKKFRMHECNLLLATSALEEGIDLPRCNLVMRWDLPQSYRSYSLGRARARANRSVSALCGSTKCTETMVDRLSLYTQLDQIITTKCGCGIQDEPPLSEESHADVFTTIINAYTPIENKQDDVSVKSDVQLSNDEEKLQANNNSMEPLSDIKKVKEDVSDEVENGTPNIDLEKIDQEKDESNVNFHKCYVSSDCHCLLSIPKEVRTNIDSVEGVKAEKSVEGVASVDLNSAIALINRYCGKLPSDTFTRLAPYWKMEKVRLPAKSDGSFRDAYICTLRLPLNAPVKYNIVGHPMPTRVLARRMVALQACRILHKSGELDDQLMPIGKENFRAPKESHKTGDFTFLEEDDVEVEESGDNPRPGTTKRRQYYYKRTASAFTDCEPIIDSTDAEIYPELAGKGGGEEEISEAAKNGTKRNMLYAIVSTLWCALPERYNTRGRRLHSPQNANQAVAILMSSEHANSFSLQIPWFPVYTRSGEVRVSIQHVENADVRLCPRRGRLVRRFMRFVFAEVLRVRRCGMKLDTKGMTHNNYYIVPTCKSTLEDGTSKVDIDWSFLELIYQHTNEKKRSILEKPILWHLDEEEVEDWENQQKQEQYPTSNESQPNEDTSEMDSKSLIEAIKSDKLEPDRDGDRKEKRVANPLLKPGEIFAFEAEKYREAVVTPWYRNQDQPQFFLVAEICWHLRPDSAFSSAAHATFREYYSAKYGASLTQRDQPLLDVDHTSARLNLLTPRYVNRKGVALPVSSERTRRAKRDRLDQKQILVPELCRVHPFAAPLWFATVALPCVLYRVNALLIADEIRRAVAIDVGLGVPRIDEKTCPGFQWPPLDFGWSLAEVLNAEEKSDSKKEDEEQSISKKENSEEQNDDTEEAKEEEEDSSTEDNKTEEQPTEKTINDILAEKEDNENGFEIGTWSNDMASCIPQTELDDLMQPLPGNLTFCTSASGGTNWCDPIEKPKNEFNPSRTFSVADSDCSFMSSDFDTDSDLNSEASEEDTEASGFNSSKSHAAMGVRIEYKTAHEAEAVEVEVKKTINAPMPDEEDDERDRRLCADFIRSGEAPKEYIDKFKNAIEEHKKEILEKSLIKSDKPINNLLPFTSHTTHFIFPCKPDSPKNNNLEDNNPATAKNNNQEEKTTKTEDIENDLSKIDKTQKYIDEIFPYKTDLLSTVDSKVTLESIEKNKRLLLEDLKNSLPKEEVKKLHCFSMKDVDIDSSDFVNEKLSNVGFDTKESYMQKLGKDSEEFKPYYLDGKDPSGEFDFDFQPDLQGHPGPSPSVILQALTMSNANDGINLERLETVGDSFLKLAITAYLYCGHAHVHEGKLSHMRSKQVSNLNLYRLGRNKRLGARMIASKFEPHDNWLPPCHTAPPALSNDLHDPSMTRHEGGHTTGCFIPYNLITQHSIPDKSIADCVEALIGAYLLRCGSRGALLFMCWLGIKVLPLHLLPLPENMKPPPTFQKPCKLDSNLDSLTPEEESWLKTRPVGSLRPVKNDKGEWLLPVFGELKAPPSPLLRYVENPEGELEKMLSGYDALERTLQYRFKDRSLLLQAMTHASHHSNTLTDCYQRLEFLGDAILDYLITRHLYEDARRHSPGALTDLRSALVNNTIFATLAVRHGFHKYFRHMSPGLNEVLTKYVKIQEENGHSISEEHYLIQEDEMEQAEDVEVPKALGDLFESVAGAIFLDSGMSLGAVWKSYVQLMGAELEAFSAAAPKSPVRELLEAEPDTAKFGKPERLADGRRVRVCVEVFGRGTFKGIGRNYRIAKGTAARCALRHLRGTRN